ncbi:MAG: SMC-Scp complex subunit ScpB [Hyphomicrobiaceae bacterium]|nr:SMC-Scp complex subunit ScpB [Hyphomicrobiaceae bacterium]
MSTPKLKLVDALRSAGSPEDPGPTSAAVFPAPPGEPGLAGICPVDTLAATDRRQKLRVLEALLFAAPKPLSEAHLAEHLPPGEDIAALLAELQRQYGDRGVVLQRVAGKWAFRTAGDLAHLLAREATEERRLSKAGLETLAIIAYHQPVTRAEIEEIRGVATSAGTLDILLDTGWVRPRGRRRSPGRPVTYGTTETFLEAFGLDQIRDLPGLPDLRAAGLLDANLPPGFAIPEPRDVAALMPDEMPLDMVPQDAGQDVLDLEDDPLTDDRAQDVEETESAIMDADRADDGVSRRSRGLPTRRPVAKRKPPSA